MGAPEVPPERTEEPREESSPPSEPGSPLVTFEAGKREEPCWICGENTVFLVTFSVPGRHGRRELPTCPACARKLAGAIPT